MNILNVKTNGNKMLRHSENGELWKTAVGLHGIIFCLIEKKYVNIDLWKS